MNREQIIADLVLHGYVLQSNHWNWKMVFSHEQEYGRMVRFFPDTEDGPAWDVRVIYSRMAAALDQWHNIPWSSITDIELHWFTTTELPPKVRHKLVPP